MLQVTLARIIHEGEKSAKNLIPLVQSCNIFSPEAANSSIKYATDREQEWLQVINEKDVTRSRLEKGISTEMSYDKRTFFVAVYGYLLRNKKPIFFLERFAEDLVGRREITHYQSSLSFNRARRLLINGNIDDFLQQYWKQEVIERQLNDERDREMARTLDQAEGYLRKTYSRFADKDPLIINGFVGRLHNPKRFSAIEISQPILSYFEPVEEEYYKNFEARATFEEMRLSILRYGVWNLCKEGTFKMKMKDLEQMDFTQLTKEVQKQAEIYLKNKND